jgi:hypothetical protein
VDQIQFLVQSHQQVVAVVEYLHPHHLGLVLMVDQEEVQDQILVHLVQMVIHLQQVLHKVIQVEMQHHQHLKK